MYTNNREAYRLAFFTAWDKHLKKMPVEAYEALLIEIMIVHPEYHSLLESHQSQTQEFNVEENPFVHMSLHFALHEQIKLDRPRGIAAIYQSLAKKLENSHEAEHEMMTCLANLMWEAQQTGTPPSESTYLEHLSKLCK